MLFPAGVTALVVAATAAAAVRTPAQPWPRALLDWALILSVCGVLFLWRRHPVVACVYALAASLAFYVLSPVDGPLLVVVMVLLYAVAADGRTAIAAALGTLLVAETGLGTLAGNEEFNGIALFMLAGWVVAMVALGTVRHGRQRYARAAVRQAEEAARLRAAEERLRIARELHDVIGHHVSMINVQAGTALHRIERDPGQAGPALGVIKEASRDTLRELRSTLGVLRQVDEAESTAPAGRLDRLDELVRYAELASLKVDIRTDGEPQPLPAGVDLAAYRILQEAITNVTRHAAAGRVRVTIGYGTGELCLDDEDDITVVGEVADGAAAVEAARADRPDVILMDIRMPRMDGLEAARRIAADLPAVRIVILTTFDLDDFVYGAMRAGVAGFLVKDTEPRDLLQAVRVAARGDGLISPSVTRRLIADYAGRAPRPEPDPRLDALTPREREVVTLVAKGLSNDEIAERLSLSRVTARSAVSRVMTKLDVRDRAGLVVLAYESGLVGPGWTQHQV